jgi:hypothetical protein
VYVFSLFPKISLPIKFKVKVKKLQIDANIANYLVKILTRKSLH